MHYLDTIVNEWIKRGLLRAVASPAVRTALLAPKQHLGAGAVQEEEHFCSLESQVVEEHRNSKQKLSEESAERNERLSKNEEGREEHVTSGNPSNEENEKDHGLSLHHEHSLSNIVKANRRLVLKMGSHVEGAVILTGKIVQLDRAAAAFVRLRAPQ
ncbi:hypothetical protein NECAME_14094, partial [Necator americanus]